jgi:2-polyprenyl-3-methyl-5-hydroxy-6-metoxy-1,4-benzoquinol methylase
MLGYNRYASLYGHIDVLLERLKGKTRPVAVDYGPGVGDMSLMLASLGFEVHMVDLVDRKSEFALWRLRRRGLSPHFIPATLECPYPSLPEHVDLVVTFEVWEHLRHPSIVLMNILNSTTPGGSLLVNSIAEDFHHEVVGDHLAEGIEEGTSGPFQELYHKHWKAIPSPGCDGKIYIRT